MIPRLNIKNGAPLPLSLPVLFLLMVLPWGWIALGMWGFKNITLTVSFYMVFGCLVPYVLFVGKKPRVSKEYFRLPLVLGGVLFGMGTMFIGWALLRDTIFIPGHFITTLKSLGFHKGQHFLLFAFYFVLINPVLEELFWRGLIYHRCRDWMPEQTAMLVSSIVFGSYHWLILQTSFTPLGAILATVSVIVGGVVFSFFYRKTNSLLAPILVHGLGYDLPIIILAYLQLSR